MRESAVVVIPARFASTRFPGKPLAMIAGKPMISHVVEQVKKNSRIERIILATDDDRIAAIGQTLGVFVAMTPADCRSGTDRVFAATRNISADWIVNVQGDEPLFEPTMLDDLLEPLRGRSDVLMATLAAKLSSGDFINPNVVKVVHRMDGRALYFSRAPIGYTRKSFDGITVKKHIGLYAYRPHFLQKFCDHSETPLELSESLEQLRALEMGYDIFVGHTEANCVGVDTPDDIEKVEKILRGD